MCKPPLFACSKIIFIFTLTTATTCRNLNVRQVVAVKT